MGQDVTLIMLALAISLALFFGGWAFTAGCVFSLCFIKYNLFLAIPLLIVGKRLWRFGSGVVVGGVALLVVSFAASGRSWPWHYIAMLRLPSTTPRYSGLPNLHGLFSFLSSSFLPEAVGTCVVIVAAWLVIRGGHITRAISATLVASLLISYHSFLFDALLIVPATLLLLDRAPSISLRLVAIFLQCPFAYLPFVVSVPFPPSIVLLLPLLVMTAEEISARLKMPVSNVTAPVYVLAGKSGGWFAGVIGAATRKSGQ
jgi:hypothetical protein